jgi:hypothetical protein
MSQIAAPVGSRIRCPVVADVRIAAPSRPKLLPLCHPRLTRMAAMAAVNVPSLPLEKTPPKSPDSRALGGNMTEYS